MRYAIISKGLTISQLQDEVKRCEGRNLMVATASKQVFCELDAAGVDKLRAAGCIVNKVGGVKADVMPPIVTPPVPVAAAPVYTAEQLVWAAGLEELRSITEPPLYGEGLNLAIIGTGIRETHQKINSRVIYRKNYTSDPMQDGFDHDTGVCSIALTMAPLCNILNLKVLDDKGEGTEEDVTLAIDDCISLHDTDPDIAPSVINLSLGAPDEANPDNPLRVASRAAIDRGIWVLASAGNNGPAPYSITCPACEQYVLAVGAVQYLPEEESFAVTDWSSRGPTLEGLVKPDAVMFGQDISIASSRSDTATVAKSGTSFAVPFCSGMCILYHEGVIRWGGVEYPGEVPIGLYPEVTKLVSVKALQDTYLSGICVKPWEVPAGKGNDYGHGLVFGPLISQAITAKPLVDISTILGTVAPILAIGMMGMVMVPMIKGLR